MNEIFYSEKISLLLFPKINLPKNLSEFAEALKKFTVIKIKIRLAPIF